MFRDTLIILIVLATFLPP